MRLSHPFMCRNDTIPFPGVTPVQIIYQCDDEPYNNFTTTLLKEPYMQNTTLHGTNWGRRPAALPPNKTILVMGNSHTRQTVLEWMCQYSDSVPQFESHDKRILNCTMLKVIESFLIVL